MKLLLRRNQNKGLMGKITFTLDVRAGLTDAEKANIDKYKMGHTMLYTNLTDRGSGILGAISRAASGIEITVDDLVRGKQIECKDIVEMIGIEEEVKEACQTFKKVLEAAASFGGEEIVEFS